jgi:hypothetical protein
MLHVDWPLVSAMNKPHKSHEARVFNQILIRSFILNFFQIFPYTKLRILFVDVHVHDKQIVVLSETVFAHA